MRVTVDLEVDDLATLKVTENRLHDTAAWQVLLAGTSTGAIAYVSAVDARVVADAWSKLADDLADREAAGGAS